MTPHDADDPLLGILAALPPVLPDEATALELRARCRARLERPPRLAAVVVEPAAVAAVSAMYAWQILRLAVR